MSKLKPASRKVGRKSNLNEYGISAPIPPMQNARPKPPQPFPFGLRYVAWHFPFGIDSMMSFAALALDKSVQRVAIEWNALDRTQKQTSYPEDLCAKAGVDPGVFLGAVIAVGYELGEDMSDVLGAIIGMPDALSMATTQACQTGQGLAEAHAVFERICVQMNANQNAKR